MSIGRRGRPAGWGVARHRRHPTDQSRAHPACDEGSKHLGALASSTSSIITITLPKTIPLRIPIMPIVVRIRIRVMLPTSTPIVVVVIAVIRMSIHIHIK